jgi:phosphodiesterase/alkaline phosphatase D-like protein
MTAWGGQPIAPLPSMSKDLRLSRPAKDPKRARSDTPVRDEHRVASSGSALTLRRREFLGGAASALLSCGPAGMDADAAAPSESEGADPSAGERWTSGLEYDESAFPLGSAAFDVSEQSALLWTRVAAPGHVAFELSERSDFSSTWRVDAGVAVADSGLVVIAQPSALAPGTRYYARPVLESAAPVYGYPCRFTTVPVLPRSLRMAWSADLQASRKPFKILDAIAKQEPDLLLLLGDCTYADLPLDSPATDLPSFRQKHEDVRVDEPLRRLLADVPTIAIWDDHDTHNNTHRDHPLMEPSRQAFRDYWPVRSADPDGIGLYRHISYGPLLEFFVIDARTFRDPPGAPAPRSMLGARQKAWLKAALSASSARHKLLVSSVPFSAPFHADSWFGFPEERDELRAHIREAGIPGVTILSGDLHMAWDIEDPETKIREFVAGPLAAWPFKDIFGQHLTTVADSGRFAVTDRATFAVMDITDTSPSATVRYFDKDGTELYETSFG